MSTNATPPPRPLQGFGPAFTWGAQLAFRPKRFVLITVVAIGLGALLGWASVADQHKSSMRHGFQSDQWYDLWAFLDQAALTYVLPLIALLFVARGFAREISERTLVYHLVRPISRSTLFLARFCSGVLPAMLTGTLLLWAMLAASGLDLPARAYIGMALVAITAALLLGAVFYLLASIFRYGTIAGLIYVFAIETMFGAARGAVQKMSMTYHLRSLFRDFLNPMFAEHSSRVAREIDPDATPLSLADGDLATRAVSVLTKPTYGTTASAITTALILTALLLAVGVWRTKRRDFPLKD